MAAVLTLLSTPLMACDICGCANSGSYFGLMPQSHKSLVGVRYQHLRFTTHADSKVLRTEEQFNVTELYGRFFPIKRVQVMAFVPYRSDRQHTSADTKRQNGLGDITVLANYNIFNSLMDTEASSAVTHTLMVGGGVKLPTGRFKFDENDVTQVANANFQPGTGSTDFILNAFYTMNISEWGLATNVSRKFNTTNAQDYRFGDQLYGTVDVYRSLTLGSLTFMPSLGLYAEHSEHGRQHGVVLEETGGKMLNASLGLSLFSNRWTLGAHGQLPVTQRSASGHVRAYERVLVQVGWLF
ncbi:transporter [Dyadobacter sp. CY261]|uniref:transporter n=1 Tax=Dyadobacter sp. CY261 TaxID=2907203 RepID=UPI001F41D11E|nr:transporter [Dyadobacter sp. CY261]